MKQKTIIQIWGRQGQGKTSTIKLILEELKCLIDPTYKYSLPLKGGEISETLNYRASKIGIESLGDDIYHKGLNKRLDNFILSQKVDILICASRIHNNVDNHIELLAKNNSYRVIKATNYRTIDRALQADLNFFSAKQVTSLVDQILNGVI